VLKSLAGQSEWPNETIVAEDGRDPRTAALVAEFTIGAPCPVHHVSQDHCGFRAGRIRNRAIARSTSDYVILIDGDMVMHRQFVADHRAAARRGYYSQGVRILLDERATFALMENGSGTPGVCGRGLGFLRRSYALRAPQLSLGLRRVSNRLIATKACNQAFWKDDLLRVNGFDEAIEGWGSEDKELCARLDNAGLNRQTLLFAAIACHLAHPPASRSLAETNRHRWQETVRTGRVRCELGISSH
jgi:glycosyltransferase involved in cell wall biosynthesis